MDAEVTIRPATKEDAEHVERIRTDSWTKAYAHFLPVEKLTTADSEEFLTKWRNRLAKEGVWMAVVDGRPEAFMTLGKTDYPESGAPRQIHSLYVHPDHQGKGIGKALIKTAAEDCLKNGEPRLSICVFTQNEPAKQLYKNLGAQFVAASSYHIFDEDHPDEAYVWTDLHELIKNCDSRSK